MTEPLRLIDWDLATSTGTRLAPRGPVVTRAQAHEAVRSLRALAFEAEDHVAQFTQMSSGRVHEQASVVDRTGWVRGNVGGFRVVMEPLIEKLAAKRAGTLASPLTSAVGSRITGAQLGVVLAYLSGKVLGQYELFLPPEAAPQAGQRLPPDGGDEPVRDGRLTLVAPNIVATERELDVDPRDFRLWVSVHEVTHRTQFTAVPWLRSHVHSEITAFLMASDLDPAALVGRVRAMAESVRGSIRSGGDKTSSDKSADADGRSLSLMEAVQTPEQRAVMNRLTAVMTLLEGHGEYVMNGVGSQVIPTVEEIGERFSHRRRGGNPADRLVRKLFGLDLKARQYADGAAFVRAVVDEAGMAGFNRVWTSPNTLPTRAEIADPELWLKRVLRPKAITQGPPSPDTSKAPDDGPSGPVAGD
jgi:coenzyme F420 biosynthesis associated uncharacterized protein